jgi:hypothetical protein
MVHLAGNLVVDPHGADEDQPLQAQPLHGLDNHARLGTHITGQVGVHHILSGHGGLERPFVEDVAIDDLDPLFSADPMQGGVDVAQVGLGQRHVGPAEVLL